jgi:hypothetical protein
MFILKTEFRRFHQVFFATVTVIFFSLMKYGNTLRPISVALRFGVVLRLLVCWDRGFESG